MNSLRQLGTALLYALVSVVLVVGGLSLAMAEGGLNVLRPTPQPLASAFPSNTAPPQASPAAPASASSTPMIVYVTATQAFAATSTTQLLTATATSQAVYPTVGATLRIYPTSTSRTYPTAVHCGPYYGWVKNYMVQQGDTLFHISTLYQTTVPALQTANCLKSTFLYPGQLLWVPNVPTITPGVTLIPTFPSSTAEGPTLTPFPYFTETATPTATITITPTNTPTPNPDP